MTQAQSSPPQQRVSLFNARERFFKVRSKLTELDRYMAEIKENEHPGVIDLATQFSILNTVSASAARQFESGNTRDINSKHLRMLSNLEGLVYEFQEVLLEAHEELTQIG